MRIDKKVLRLLSSELEPERKQADVSRVCYVSAADAIELAVNKTLDDGYHTGDIMQEGMIKVGCSKIGDIVRERI